MGKPKTIQIDSREKAKAITKILAEFDEQGIQYYVSKLFVGDYMSLDNPRLVIDRKQNLGEVVSNVCQQHERFKAELVRANEMGIKVIILVEHSRHINSIEDVAKWKNPRIKFSPRAMRGYTLAKVMQTMQEKYDCEFLFCDKQNTGKVIIDLLGSEE